MGQINIGRTLDITQVQTPPTGVDGFYNLNGDLFRIDSSGNTYSVLSSGITGTGSTGKLPVWTGTSTIGSSNIEMRQIAITVSSSEVATLDTAPKQLLTGGGAGKVNVPVDVWIKVTPISGTISAPVPTFITAGGPGNPPALMSCNPFGGSVGNTRRFRFTPEENTNATIDEFSYIDNNEILLQTQVAPTGGSASAVVYMTYFVYDENGMLY